MKLPREQHKIIISVVHFFHVLDALSNGYSLTTGEAQRMSYDLVNRGFKKEFLQVKSTTDQTTTYHPKH